MSKIFSIGMVKNNVEGIESHVRYNLNIFDGMIILDNGSTDGTLEILQLLEREGLPLYLLIDEDREYEQDLKTNQLLLKAINEFNADVVVPLDSDEFLISENQGNPRKFLERIEPNTFHLVKWKTYVPDLSKNNERFIPSKIVLARDDTLEEFYKVIIPKMLIKDYEVQVTFGNHNIVYDSQYDNIIKSVINSDLRIAHFPLISKEQAISKIAISWIYNCYRPGKRENENFHLKNMFNNLKKNGNLDDKDVINLAKGYALEDYQSQIKLKEDPMDLSFCTNIKMKYTTQKVKPLHNLLESFEWLAMDAANFKKQSIVDEQNLKGKFKKQIIAQEQRYKEQIQKYESSNSWKVTAPLRKFINLIKKLK